MTQAFSTSPNLASRVRRQPLLPPGVVLIGASTGGPQALVVLIAGLAPVLTHLPVCVTLHLPSDLMPVIAAHVARTCKVQTEVVVGDRRLDPGVVYFAPGDRHLSFARGGAGVRILLAPGMPGDVCRPSIDVMFKSAAATHGARALGIVLSGMGKDGLEGARAIVAAGGSVLVQDKATSAVWGMPGAVAKANLAAAVLAPAAMAREVVARTTSDARIA